MTAYLEVNEARLNLYSSATTADWWARFRQRFNATGRIVTTVTSVVGDTAYVECDDADEAVWLMNVAIGRGAPSAALRVVAARPDATDTTFAGA